MTEPTASSSSSYAAAGVDTAAGDRAVELMKASVARTSRAEVLGGLVKAFKDYEQKNEAAWRK